MELMKSEFLDLRLMDCMELMKDVPDDHYDLAVVDPPYGSENIKGGYTAQKGRTKNIIASDRNYNNSLWVQEAPDEHYFKELFRVSKEQIIWGSNHFISNFALNSSSWIVWDKLNGESHFADCELAWTSHSKAVRKFEFRWNGMIQGDMKNKEERIHPTQKPVALYNWIFANYAKPGMRVLDTHLGSGSSAIAAHYAGMHFTGCELDPDYYREASERVERETAQMTLL